jgi:hypothetical protein
VVELLLGCVVFLALMAALFVPLESFFPAHAAKPTPRAMAMGAGLLVLNTLLMDALGWPVLAMLNAAVGREVKASVVVVVFVFFASDLVGYAAPRGARAELARRVAAAPGRLRAARHRGRPSRCAAGGVAERGDERGVAAQGVHHVPARKRAGLVRGVRPGARVARVSSRAPQR